MKRDLITNEQLCALAKRGDADAQNLLIEKIFASSKRLHTKCGAHKRS